METLITINAHIGVNEIAITGYDEKGHVRDLSTLKGKRIVSIEAFYDDIRIVTED